MKRGRGRPPKTPTYSSKILNSGRRGSHHGGPSSPRVTSPQGIKTRESNRSTQRKHYFEGIQFSDSDTDSDSSYESTVSSVVSSIRSYKSTTRLRVIPMRSVTPLKLPPSSDDIILPPEHVLEALSIYEVLRQFGRILRLTPFRYEDFCAAIDSAEQSVLLSQIHMALFRALLLEDETNGYTFAASDEKDSLNIFLHEVDCFTWPEHIRSYFFSDQAEFGDLFKLVCGRHDLQSPFPFVSIEDRLKVLKRLCDIFLTSNTVREIIINEGITESEDHCRNCSKMGDLLCCENCPAVYHLHCLKPPLEMVPAGDWLCPICDEHRLKGVTDCHTDWTKDGWLRHTPLAIDREGRKYWFLSRRLFVESDNETVRYYSCKAHFDELIEYIEADGQERRLLSTLKNKYNTIIKHMAITESLIEALRGNMTSGLLPRRKHVEVKKTDDTALESEPKDDDTKPEVSLTFVPDDAVEKMVTKGNQESSAPELDKRTMAMKAKAEATEEDQEEPMSVDDTSSSPEKDNVDDTNSFPEKESPSLSSISKVVDVSCKTDVTVESQSPEAKKGDTDLSQKVKSETFDNNESSDKDISFTDSPVCATSGHGAVSVLTVKKAIDFGSHETEESKDLSQTTKQSINLESNETMKPESELDKQESSNKSLVQPDLQHAKPVNQQIKLESNQVDPDSQLNKSAEADEQDQQVIKTESEQVKQDQESVKTVSEQDKPDSKGVKPDTQLGKPEQETKPEQEEPKGPFFRLGMEGNFTGYINHFATNPLALNKHQHMEYKERKRAVHNKFSVEHEFKICGEIFGPKDIILNTLRCSIVNIENNIPISFMHPIWPLQRSTWIRAVHMASTPVEFGAVLIFLESLIKPVCFIPVWQDALGHLELHRAIVETRAERAAKKREQKEEEEEVEVQHRALVNYSWIPMHQIWKQKGEEYRIFKGGGWTWHSGMTSRKRKQYLTRDKRDFECKKRKLTKVVEGFVSKREAKKKEAERKAKARQAVQAYKDNLKTRSSQSVTQVSGSTVAAVGTSVTQGVSGASVTQSIRTSVTQSTAGTSVTQSTVETSVTQGAIGTSIAQPTASVGTGVAQGAVGTTASVGTGVAQGAVGTTASVGTGVAQGAVGTSVTQGAVGTSIAQPTASVGTGVAQGVVETSVTQGAVRTSIAEPTAGVGTGVAQGSFSANVTQTPSNAGNSVFNSGVVKGTGSRIVTLVKAGSSVTQPTNVTQRTVGTSVTQPTVTQATTIVGTSVAQSPVIANVTQLPVTGDGTQLPVSANVTQLPVGANVPYATSAVGTGVTQLPVTGKVTQLPLTANVKQLPVHANVTQLPVTGKVTQLPVSANVTQLHVPASVTQLPVPANVTELPIPANVTQLPVSANVTQLPVSANVTQLPVSANVTPLPVPANVTQLPVSANVTQLPVPANVTQLPVSANVTPLPVPANVTQLPVSANVTQLPVSANVTQLPVSANVTQLPVSANVTPLPVPANVTQLPVSANVTQLPVSANVTQLPVPANVTQLPGLANVTQLPVPANVLSTSVTHTSACTGDMQGTYSSHVPEAATPVSAVIATQSVPIVPQIAAVTTPNMVSAMIPTTVPTVTQPNVTQSILVADSKVMQSTMSSPVVNDGVVNLVTPSNSLVVSPTQECAPQPSPVMTSSVSTVSNFSNSVNVHTNSNVPSESSSAVSIPNMCAAEVAPHTNLDTHSSKTDMFLPQEVELPTVTDVPITTVAMPTATSHQNSSKAVKITSGVEGDSNGRSVHDPTNDDDTVKDMDTSETQATINSNYVDKLDKNIVSSDKLSSQANTSFISSADTEALKNCANTSPSSSSALETLKSVSKEMESLHEIIEEDEWVIIEPKANTSKELSNHMELVKDDFTLSSTDECTNECTISKVGIQKGFEGGVNDHPAKSATNIENKNKSSNMSSVEASALDVSKSKSTIVDTVEHQSQSVASAIAKDIINSAVDIAQELNKGRTVKVENATVNVANDNDNRQSVNSMPFAMTTTMSDSLESEERVTLASTLSSVTRSQNSTLATQIASNTTSSMHTKQVLSSTTLSDQSLLAISTSNAPSSVISLSSAPASLSSTVPMPLSAVCKITAIAKPSAPLSCVSSTTSGQNSVVCSALSQSIAVPMFTLSQSSSGCSSAQPIQTSALMTPLPGKLIAANSSPNDSSNLITGAHPTSSQTTLLPSITGPAIDTASPNASTNLIARKLSDCPTIGTTASNTSTNIVTSDLLASSQSTLLPTALYPQTVAVSLSSKSQHAVFQPTLLPGTSQTLVTTCLPTPVVTPATVTSMALKHTSSDQGKPVLVQTAASTAVIQTGTVLSPPVSEISQPIPSTALGDGKVETSVVTQVPVSGVLPVNNTTVTPPTCGLPLHPSIATSSSTIQSVPTALVPVSNIPVNTVGPAITTQLPASITNVPGNTNTITRSIKLAAAPTTGTSTAASAFTVSSTALTGKATIATPSNTPTVLVPSSSAIQEQVASPSIAALPASTASLPGIITTVSPTTTPATDVSTSLLAKARAAILAGQTSTVPVTTTQESLGVSLTKTLLSTAIQASQGTPAGGLLNQVAVIPTSKGTQQKVVKVVSSASGTRPQPIAAKPTTQLRAIAPQPPLLQPGQSTLIQTSPHAAQLNVLSGNALPGGSVLKINTPIGSSAGTPVNNIAALVASLPGNTSSPGQTQLIRFVTPTGQTFTIQGTIQPGPPGQSGTTTISVPKSLLSKQPAAMKPVTMAAKTVATTVARNTVTVPRPQQPIVPKVSKPLPEKKENFPMLEPLVKDPRKLLDRVIAKWRNNRCSVKSVFELQRIERKVLGRRAGMKEVHGFMYSTRGSGVNWPASFPRPCFKLAWKYRSRSLRTLAGAGLQARILHACLKWEDINIRPPRSSSSTICTSTGTTSSEVINHRYVTPDGLNCEYLVRKIVRTMKKPLSDISRPPPPTKSKRGRTLRPKINLIPDDEDEEAVIHTGPRVFESWCPESELELWEIRQYHERKERERALEREKRQQEEAARRAAELRAAAIQRRQQEQQARQQQQLLKKKVQNAIKTQQKKASNVNQAAVRTVHKPITLATMSSSGITSAQVIRPATTIATAQQQPRLTNIVTQYRPTTLSAQQRVPVGTPASGMIRTVSRAQVNYRPLATTTAQAKNTSQVAAVRTVTTIPIAARTSHTNAPKMKHSSKEQQQAKQIAKAKGKKVAGVGLGQATNKKQHLSLEARQDMYRMQSCRKLIDHLIHKIERNEELERSKESKKKAVVQKQQRAKASKLDSILYKRKELLKKEIIRKRAALEKELIINMQKQVKKEGEASKKRKRESSLGAAAELPVDKKQKTEDLYCICKKAYDPTMFYIGCDLCANWFHGMCVGITPEAASNLDHFTCPECSKAQQGVTTEELYCLCRQPYDESQFYIGCDNCHDWFHGTCVNISEQEADQLDSYVCPRCKESQSSRDVQPLSGKDYDSLKRLLRSLQSHKMAWPFLEPVSAQDVPGYYEIIKDPMDLSKIEDRLSSKHYKTVEQFNADITTMFDNCRFFNPKESPYYRCAEVLEGFFVKKLRAWQKKT